MIQGNASVVDFQALGQLKRSAEANDPAALVEAAQQFESLIIGLMLKSARDAQLGDGLFDNSQSKQYLELMDQQVALELARKGGFGFGDMIMEQLGATQMTPAPAPDSFTAATPADFVRELLPEARKAGERLGVAPGLLLAQAALETGWGQSMPNRPSGASSNNLFGIKAGGSWHGPSVAQWTLENVDGVMTRQRAQFRAYADVAESFADYADLIAQSSRYASAVENGADPTQYAREIAAAGYATDPDYAEKWLAVFNGETLRGALASATATPQGSTAAADTMAAASRDLDNW